MEWGIGQRISSSIDKPDRPRGSGTAPGNFIRLDIQSGLVIAVPALEKARRLGGWAGSFQSKLLQFLAIMQRLAN
jgi:hypothetical protein